MYRKKEDECSLPEDERSELEAELECPVCLGMRIRGCISIHSYRNPPTSLYISTKERWVCMSILFLSIVQMLKHKRKVAGRAYTVLNLDIFIQTAHVCNLTL